MEKWNNRNSNQYFTYNLQSFLDLKFLFDHLEDFYNSNLLDFELNAPKSISSYLAHISFKNTYDRLLKQSSSLPSFINNWYQYFDGFRVLKYLHYARDNFHEDLSVITQVEMLASLSWKNDSLVEKQPLDWLKYYRKRDKAS
jgi:hypothetical protein